MKYKLLVCLLFVVGIQTNTYAQTELPGFLKKIHIGFSYTNTSADFHGLIFKRDAFKNDIVNYVNHTQTLKSHNAFGFSIGTLIPVVQISPYLSLAVSTELSYQNLRWEEIKTDLLPDVPIKSLTGSTGLPTSLDLKFGCDAAPKYSTKIAATIGAGAFPAYNTTSFENHENSVATLTPFAKAEVGYLAGICFKFRVMYAYNGLRTQYVSDDKVPSAKMAGVTSPFSLRASPSSVIFSLIVMPFSYSWKPAEKWMY